MFGGMYLSRSPNMQAAVVRRHDEARVDWRQNLATWTMGRCASGYGVIPFVVIGFIGPYELTHMNGKPINIYQLTRIVRWDRGILNGSLGRSSKGIVA